MSDSGTEIVLEACLDISHANAFSAQVREAFEASDAITINGAAVERITTPAIQILLSLFNTADKANNACYVAKASDAMQ